MKRFFPISLFSGVLLLGVSLASVVHAANSWRIPGEELARFDAKVVDVLCELTGDCPANCGGGKRQLGVLRPDGTLVLAVKSQNFFAGAVPDLLPHCGETITVDGLLIKDEHMTMFALQYIKTKGGKWQKADRRGDDFVADNPGKKGNQWFRHHPVIDAHLKKNGVLGLPGVDPLPAKQ